MARRNNANDEINIYEHWKVVEKRKIIVIGVVALFVVAATIISFLLPKIYRGDVVLTMHQAANVPANELVDFVEKIDSDKTAIKLFPTTHKLISDVNIKVYKGSANKLLVSVDATDKNAIQPAVSELIQYINTIDIVMLNVKEEQERLLKRSAELSSVIASSVELLKIYDRLLKAGRLVPVGFNPIDLSKRISDIKMEKFLVEQQIQRLKGGVEIARELSIKDGPVKPAKRQYVIIAGICGLMLGVILALIRESREKSNATKKESMKHEPKL